MSTPNLSNLGWIALGQLARKSPYGVGWYDGDLVTKSGRDELVKAGLAERINAYGIKMMVNTLTKEGAALAARLSDQGAA